MKARWQNEKERHRPRARAEGAARGAATPSSSAPSAQGDLERAAEIRYGELAQLEKDLEPSRGQLERAAGRGRAAHRGGDRRGHRRGRLQVDRHPGAPSCWRASRRSCCTWRTQLRQRVVGQDEALRAVSNAVRRARAGLQDPNRPDRLVHLPRAHRRRQDRAGPRAGRVPVRRRARHGAHRHERVHGEAHRGAPDRRASRLRRLRGGRPADRGRAAPALLRGALRRDREGAPRRLQRAAADARRRPPHRRPGPHGGLPQHGPHHDLQHRQPAHRRARRDERDEMRAPRGPRRCARTSGPSS